MGGRARKGTGVWRLPDPAPTCDLEKLAAAHLAVPHPEKRKGYRGGNGRGGDADDELDELVDDDA